MIPSSVTVTQTEESKGVLKSTAILKMKASSTYNGKELVCIVQHNGGKRASKAITLNVLYVPRNVKISMDKMNVIEGNNISLTCNSDSNPKPISYQWFEIRDAKTISLKHTEKHISILNIKRNSSLYYCTVQNQIGVAQSKQHFIDVEYQPYILPDSDCELIEGAVSCLCQSDSKPPASISWNVNGSSDMKAFNTSLEVRDNTVSGILMGRVEAQVIILCSATNEHGTTIYRLPVTQVPSESWNEDKGLPIAVTCVTVLIAISAVIGWKKYYRKVSGEPVPIPASNVHEAQHTLSGTPVHHRQFTNDADEKPPTPPLRNPSTCVYGQALTQRDQMCKANNLKEETRLLRRLSITEEEQSHYSRHLLLADRKEEVEMEFMEIYENV
nr:PREDICTED: Schwann cell myelin protein-like [Lepisosteus oculatus]